MKATWVLPFVVATLVALCVAALGATITDLGPWYQALEKPDWTPPDPMFPMAWTLMYALIVVSAVTAWRAAPDSAVSERIVSLFALNGFLNITWSLLFFRLQRPDWAFYELIALWLSIVALIIYCGRYSRGASLLLVPYLGWVSMAGALNWAVVQLNPPFN
jgi:tryptophan-rich sensory protein